MIGGIHRAGFVLAGGKSSRMGENKAFLRRSNTPLVQHIAQIVQEAAGCATVIGDPALYGGLGFPVVPDRILNAGPLAGLETALSISEAKWNLVVACDMPALQTSLLRQLLEEAEALPEPADCLMPVHHPLCAVYHRRCLPMIRTALNGGIRRVFDMLAMLRVVLSQTGNQRELQNVNTPQDWEEFLRSVGSEPCR